LPDANERAGILSDITVMRRGERDFFVGVNGNIDINYLRQAARTRACADITPGLLGWGFRTNSRELAQSLTRMTEQRGTRLFSTKEM